MEEARRNDPCPCGSGQRYKKCCAGVAPDPVVEKIRQAVSLVSQGDYETAANLFGEPDSSEAGPEIAYCRLGVVLTKQGLAEEAVAAYRKALTIKPENADALNNLGVILNELGDYSEAATCFRQALALKPAEAGLNYNLGVALIGQRLYDESWRCFAQTITLKKDYVEAHYNQGSLLVARGLWLEAAACFRRALSFRPDYPRTHTQLAIIAWMVGDFDACGAHLRQIATTSCSLSARDAEYVGPYSHFLGRLLDYRGNHAEAYRTQANRGTVYAIGESHCLSLAQLNLIVRGKSYRGEARIVVGAKAWHLGRIEPNKFKYNLENIVAALPAGSLAVILFGEIDCRPDEGILRHHKKTGTELNVTIPRLVEDYLTYINRIFRAGAIEPLIANVPAPLFDSSEVTESDRKLRVEIIRIFNRALAGGCKSRGMAIVDAYGASIGEDGTARAGCHLDRRHLRPDIYQKVLATME